MTIKIKGCFHLKGNSTVQCFYFISFFFPLRTVVRISALKSYCMPCMTLCSK